MSRRILCLALAAALFCLAGPAALAAEAPVPSETPVPAEEAVPAEDAAPDTTPEPFVRPRTTATPRPVPTPAPTATPIPEASGGAWSEQDGGRYYLDAGGQPVTGWRVIDGQTYYFRPSGRMAVGWVGVEGKRYYFGDDGQAYTGLRYADSPNGAYGMYLFADDGVMRDSGSVTLLGKQFTIGSDGVIQGYATDVSPKAAAVLDQVGWDLRAAFNWSASMPYFDRENRAPEGVVHSEWYADYGFTNGQGNCYVMAATFYQMAKLLGSEVYFIEGYVGAAGGGVIPHSWTEIVINGNVFVFDPDFTNEEGIDGFQIWYEKPDTWWYYEYQRVD